MRVGAPGLLLPLLLCACGQGDLDVRESREFYALVPRDAEVEVLGAGLGFTEGPVWFEQQGGFLVYSDLWSDRQMKWSRGKGIEVFRDPAPEPNGNTLDAAGRLLTCEHDSRQVTRTEKDGTVVPLITRYQGRRFNSPNDLVVRSDGSIWFTDPTYGLKDRPAELGVRGVYRFEPDTGRMAQVAADFDQPNGLCFSPDEARLYVADSGEPGRVYRFEITPGNTLENRSEFYRPDRGRPDGLRCGATGHLFISAGDGVHVVHPDGRLLGKILAPDAVTNLCFGGPGGSTLFITARSRLLAVLLASKQTP